MIKLNYVDDTSKVHVVCDTNVWYKIVTEPIKNTEDVFLIPTSLTLYEIATSQVMAHDLSLYQKVINAIKEHGKQIIAVNPFDFVLRNHDSNFEVDCTLTKNILEEFNEVRIRVIPEGTELDSEIKDKIIEMSKLNRKMTSDFADFGTDALIQIRKNINLNKGKEEHLKVDTTHIIIDMMKSILTDYVKDKGYAIDFKNFEWNNLELFVCVTENYFKKLEVTKGMKISNNDAVDWLNMLYVTPKDKYLTYEKSWRNYIQEDIRIANYLFE